MPILWRVLLLGLSVGSMIPGVAAQNLIQTSDSVSNPMPPVLPTEAAFRFVGGPDFRPTGMEVDAAGNIYVAGNDLTQNADGNQGPYAELYKLNPQFQQVFRLSLAGAIVRAMALDPAGDIYLIGATTYNTDFPLVNPIPVAKNSGGFLTKVDPEGNLLFSTLLGEASRESPLVLTVDTDGNAYIGGLAYLLQPPTTTATTELFVAKIATGTSTLEYSTTFGEDKDQIYGIAEAGGGDVFLLLSQSATDFPVTDGSMNDGNGQLLERLSSDGSKVVYASYAPTSQGGLFSHLLLDRDGNLLLAGSSDLVTIDVTTNMEISRVSGFGASGLTMDDDGNFLRINGGFDGPISKNGVGLGMDVVWKNAPDGTILFRSRLPKGVAEAGIAAGPNGAVYLLGRYGSVMRIFPDRSDASMVFPRLLSIANAAGDRVSSKVAPGEIMSLYGLSIGSPQAATTQIGTDGLVTTALSSVEVHFNRTPGRMLYTGPTQVNVQAPFAWGQGDSVLVEVFHGGDLWTSTTLNPVDADPEVFRSPGQTVIAAALNQDQTVNSQNNGAAAGSIVTIFLSGVGEMMGAAYQDGEVFDPSTPIADLPKLKLPVIVLSGGVSVATGPGGATSPPTPRMQQEILYAGQAPASLAGVIQVNFQMPQKLLASMYPNFSFEPLYLKVGDFPPVFFDIWVTTAEGQ